MQGFVSLSSAQMDIKYFEIHIWFLATKNRWKALLYQGCTQGVISLTGISKPMETVMDLR